MALETAFTMDTSSVKYGMGVTREVGFDMRSLGARRVMVVVDPALSQSETASITLKALADEGIDTAIYDGVHIEPTDASFKEAASFAADGGFDGFVAIGGGSTINAQIYTRGNGLDYDGWAQAGCTSPSRIIRPPPLASSLARRMRWTQKVHFSITPRLRTVISGLSWLTRGGGQ